MCDFIQINTNKFKVITLRLVKNNVVVASNIIISIKKVCDVLGIDQKIITISDEGGALQNRQQGDISLKKNISPNRTAATTPFLRKYLVLANVTDNDVDLVSMCKTIMSLVLPDEYSSISTDSNSSIPIDSNSSISTDSSISADLSILTDSSISASSASDSSASESSVSISSESLSSYSSESSFVCAAPVFGAVQLVTDAIIGEYVQITIPIDSNPLNPPQFIVNNLPSGMSSYQYPGGDFIVYGTPDSANTFLIDITAYYNECSELQSSIQLTLNITIPCYEVSGTNTQYDGTYTPDIEEYVHYNYDTLITEIIPGPSSQGPKYVFRNTNNSNLAIFWHDTYQIWALSDLSVYNSGPPEGGLYAGNYGAPPIGSWYSPMYSTYVQQTTCPG